MNKWAQELISGDLQPDDHHSGINKHWVKLWTISKN